MVSVVHAGDKRIISPSFIYNRIDLFDENALILCCEYNKQEYTVEFSITGRTAVMGAWLMDLPSEVLSAFCSYIFSNYKKILKIRISNTFQSFGLSVKTNHFRIEMPETEEELLLRRSSKGRHNLRRKKKLLEDNCGAVRFENYTSETVPDRVFDDYFAFKKISHGKEYSLSKKEYIKNYHVSDIYVLYAGDSVASIILSCEQCPAAYLENLTYNPQYSVFSPGQILYQEYLLALVRKKTVKQLFLGGGSFDYKLRYGSIEETVYENTVMRSGFWTSAEKVLRKAKKAAKRILRR